MCGGVCHLCSCSLPAQGYDRFSSFDLDHDISQEAFLAAGLPVDHSIKNLRIAHGTRTPCPEHGPCNSRKGHKSTARAREWIQTHPWQGAVSDDFEDFEDCVLAPEPEPVDGPCIHGKPPGKYCFDCKGGIA